MTATHTGVLEGVDMGAEHTTNLEEILNQADVPTLPVVAQKLVELCKDDSGDFAQFARLIETDQGLASRILRVANSAYYGLRHKTTSVERAISALGLKYVKTISLGFHLATTVSQFRADGFNMTEFWREGVLHAVMARQVASSYCRERCEEAFLVGLLQNCGIPFLVQALGARYAQVWNDRRNSQAGLYQIERELFDYDHITAAKIITKQWKLPELLAVPICHHHQKSQSQPSMDEQVQLSQIAYFVGTLSFHDPQSLHEEDRGLIEYAQSAFNLNFQALEKLFQRTQDEFHSIAKLFSGILPENVDISELLAQAKHLLGDLALDAYRDQFNCEKEIHTLEDQYKQLASTIDQYYQQTQTDTLTGLKNRLSLSQYLLETFSKVARKETSLTLIFLRIDQFQEINSRYGHTVGDHLLLKFASLLKALFRDSGDVFRYGGVEIVITLMGLSLRQAQQLLDALIPKISKLDLKNLAPGIPGGEELGFNVGMIHAKRGAELESSDKLLELAGRLMYESAKQGRNTYKYEVLPAPGEGDTSSSAEGDV